MFFNKLLKNQIKYDRIVFLNLSEDKVILSFTTILKIIRYLVDGFLPFRMVELIEI
jgi:hypothetical protein